MSINVKVHNIVNRKHEVNNTRFNLTDYDDCNIEKLIEDLSKFNKEDILKIDWYDTGCSTIESKVNMSEQESLIRGVINSLVNEVNKIEKDVDNLMKSIKLNRSFGIDVSQIEQKVVELQGVYQQKIDLIYEYAENFENDGRWKGDET